MLNTATLNTLVMSADRWNDNGPAFWPIFPILWFLFFVTFAYLVVRWGRRNRAECGIRTGQARLAERFAAGEIDEQEYRSRKAVLEEKS